MDVIYRDEWLLAVDKPAGIIVHGDGTGTENLTDLVRAETGNPAAQPVQRLDRDTTGLVLFSLDKSVQPELDAAIANHEVRKRYLAIVQGRIGASELVIDRPIGRDRHRAGFMRVSKTGKPALTRVWPLERRGAQTLVLVELETGRKHQIRVHLASEGYPLMGDVTYGGPSSRQGLMLHAYEERLIHPVLGTDLVLCTPWPTRMLPKTLISV